MRARRGGAALLATAGATAILGAQLVVPAAPSGPPRGVPERATPSAPPRGIQEAGTAAALPPVPRFEVAASPIGLRGDVRRGAYLGVIGRRAAWLGSEEGQGELWIHPLKVASRFRLDFRIPDYLEPVRGEEVARTVELRPELATVTYSHATFTVREHILAPLEEPGLLLLLEVETSRPLEIVVSFRSVLQYAWPGSLGGQYAYWDAGYRAFILSESLRRHNAVVGSPWATEGSSHPAHALPEAPSTFVIPVDTLRARREFVPIAAAAAIAPRDSVLALYQELLARAPELYEERRAHADSLLTRAAVLDTPDDSLDLAFRWALVNLDESLACNPDLGCGLVAGWGPSGESSRPGFGWFFGGDAAINSFAMDLAGLWREVAMGLRFLARYQREDGKIPHEISQAAARIPWFTDFPYTYYHADTTPYWIVAVWRYWKATGDGLLLRELWSHLLKAYAWCLGAETDGDGIIENTAGGLGAVEVGALGEEIHQDIYLAAVWIEALKGLAEMAAAVEDRGLEAEATELRDRALETLESRYWREREGRYAFGILRSGRTNDALTVWPATAAAFGLLDRERADRMLEGLTGDRITTEWGARMLTAESPLYDPLHYNNGTVWPFVTGFLSWGHYVYRRPWAGFPLVDALARMTFHWSRGRHPELLSGSFYRPLDTAVPQQFFATSMLVTPLLAGVLGWEPDAPAGRARLAPQLPPAWDRLAVRGLRVGQTRLEVALRRGEGSLDVTVARAGPPVVLEVVLALPAGAREISGERWPPEAAPRGEVTPGPRETTVRWSGPLTAETTLYRARWQGGLEVEPPTTELRPGQASGGLRVLDFRFDEGGGEGGWTALLEGRAGGVHELHLRGEPVGLAPGVTEAEVAREGEGGGEPGVTVLRVRFPGDGGPRGRAVRMVRLVPVPEARGAPEPAGPPPAPPGTSSPPGPAASAPPAFAPPPAPPPASPAPDGPRSLPGASDARRGPAPA